MKLFLSKNALSKRGFVRKINEAFDSTEINHSSKPERLRQNVRMLVAVVRVLDTEEVTFYQLPDAMMTCVKVLRLPPAD